MQGVRARVLIVSASIGGGHVAAGRALEGAFARLGCETLHVDLLDYTSAPFRRLYRQAYFDLLRTAPEMVDWLGKRLDRAPRQSRLRNLRLRARLIRLISYHLPRTIRAYRPTVLVHTHFLPPEMFSVRARVPLPQSVVVTDFAAHRLWVQPGVGRYYVAADEVKAHMLSMGVGPEHVRVSGIPIDFRFAQLPSREAARRSLGYGTGRDLLLLMAGGMSGGTLREVLHQLRNMRLHLQIVVVCGRSPDLRNIAFEMLDGYEGPVQFDVQGLSSEVPILMAAADLLIGKPGGLTTSEALASGLPFAIVDPYPLQEEANANYLLEYGAGMRIEPLSTLELKVGRFLGDRERRTRMSRAASEVGKPHASFEIATDLLENPLPTPYHY